MSFGCGGSGASVVNSATLRYLDASAQSGVTSIYTVEAIDVKALEQLVRVHPEQVAAWRDSMRERGYANATIRRRMTALRSLFSVPKMEKGGWADGARAASARRGFELSPQTTHRAGG